MHALRGRDRGWTALGLRHRVPRRHRAAAAPGFEARVKALEKELGARTDRSERGFLHDLVVRDIASLQNLLVEVSEADLKKAVTLLEKAEVDPPCRGGMSASRISAAAWTRERAS